MFYSPFRFFFKNSDNLGQKVVNFSLGPPSPPYSLLKCDAYGETCPCTFYLFLAFFNIEYKGKGDRKKVSLPAVQECNAFVILSI